jgi:hypothetical protein
MTNATSTAESALARRHPEGTVESYRLAAKHSVLDNGDRQVRRLALHPESTRVVDAGLVHARSPRAHEPDQFVALAAGAASTRTPCPATAMSERAFSAARSRPITIDGDWRIT